MPADVVRLGDTRQHDPEPYITDEDIQSLLGGAAARLVGLSNDPVPVTPHC